MPKKILCIDDDPAIIELYTTILEREGYEVENARDGAEGLAKAKRVVPDLIVLDIMLPEKSGFLDGYGLLKEFRRMEELKSTPVIMVSAMGGDEDARKGIALGASLFLAKQDLVPSVFVQKVKELLSR